MHDDLTPERVRLARLLAGLADLLQLALLPGYLTGGLALANNLLDVALALALLRLVGWHWAFLPTFLAEMIPGVELVPSWTAAVFLATRGRSGPDSKSVTVDVTPASSLPVLERGEATSRPSQTPRASSGE
jgi:hypothetical protein